MKTIHEFLQELIDNMSEMEKHTLMTRILVDKVHVAQPRKK